MLPSLLACDIQQGIKQFLITGFEPADGYFHGVMRRFVDNEPAWLARAKQRAALLTTI